MRLGFHWCNWHTFRCGLLSRLSNPPLGHQSWSDPGPQNL